jgi:hypothetical protein
MTELIWKPYLENGGFLAEGPDIGGTVYFFTVQHYYDRPGWFATVYSAPPQVLGSEPRDWPVDFASVGEAMEFVAGLSLDEVQAWATSR